MKKSALLLICGAALLFLGSCKSTCPKFSLKLGSTINATR
jgi:hypothetical protein